MGNLERPVFSAPEPPLTPGLKPTGELSNGATKSPQIIRILLASDPSVFRDGLVSLLGAQPDFQVLTESARPEAVVLTARKLSCHIVLLDAESSAAAIQSVRALQESELASRVILLTSSDDPEFLALAVRHGVAGILSRRSPTELLIKSIHKVNAGELWLDRATTADVVRQLTNRPIPAPRNLPQTDKPVALSRREREIVALVAQGFRNREIADKLFISEQTVKNHMHNIFEKIGVQDRLELALYAIYHRLYE